MMPQEVHISIAEVVEVRGYGLNAPELLSLAVSSSDRLPACPKGVVFDMDHVFISSKGTVEIKTCPSSKIDVEYVPPEWAKGEEDPQAAAVYCLGAVLRAAGAEEASDVDLFSLVNILTVAMTGTRPTAHRMGQMARNQLRGRDPTSMLMCVYEELMGDDETNQLDDMLDLDDEDLLSNDGASTRHDDGATRIGGVVSAGGGVKRAVEYFDDDIETRDGASTSTSSGNSTQKETSPFGYYEPHAKVVKDSRTSTISEEKTPPVVIEKKPTFDENHHHVDDDFGMRSPMMFEDTTLDNIGSPLSQSTRLDETYIEEKSIDMSSFNSRGATSPFDDNFVDASPSKSKEDDDERYVNVVPKTVLQPPTPTMKESDSGKRLNPFDDDDNEDFHGGTLSGRDPFDDDSGSANEKKAKNEARKHVYHKKEAVGHRLSSSSEEIIEATINDTDEEEKEEKLFSAKPQLIPHFDKAYDADFDNSPPLHRYDAVPLEPGLSPLEEAQRALRANKARHKPSNVSTVSTVPAKIPNEEPAPRANSRQRYSNVSEFSETKRARREDEEEGESGSENEIPTETVVTKKREVVEERHTKEVEEISRPVVYSRPYDNEQVAPVSARPPRGQTVEREISEVVEVEEENIDEIFDQYKKKSEKTTTTIRQTPILSRETDPKRSVAASTPIEEVDSPAPFVRKNSLVPSRISGRQSIRRSVTSIRSMRGKRKTRAIPEFYDLSRHSSIRLRAPVSKKKKLSLHRVEDTEVVVELLNGQKIEIACRSDIISRDVFSLVVQHMNINEHVFFGLSFLRDGEHFFIEDHQRLEKFAPSGWKSIARVGLKSPYMLHLRFRFYPQILDFIKTDVTMNELYLQCRRDVLEERIQPRRDAAFELAALALQAEFGNRPPPVIVDYFDIQHYLDKRFCSFEDPARLKNILSELHGHYAGTRIAEAKHKYIQICQRHSDFGCHIHRVFRTKPSQAHGASPFDPDTGSSLWIGIMPRGISIYEQQGGVREMIVEHLWPQTQTLQFDKKRFVIVAMGVSEEQVESTFYTDHHTKSAYFVKFAASQHRWMMKMRQWKSTLRHENTVLAMPDVCVEGRQLPPALIRQSLEDSPRQSPILASAESMFSKMPETPTTNGNSGTRPSTMPPPVPSNAPTKLNQYDAVDEGIVIDSQAENFERVTRDPEDSSPRGTQFEVVLRKDPQNGLGLTLVDGNLNGVPGVYVKLVAENGAGMKEGVCVGDRLVKVGHEDLVEGDDRLKAVELVRRCGDVVPLTIARIDGIIRHEKNVSSEIMAGKKKTSSSSVGQDSLSAPNRSGASGASRTPPAPRRAANRRQRAVSDFGAIGDALPTLDGDNLIDIKAISGLHLDESDEEKGEYRLPTTSMYNFDRDDELNMSTKEKKMPVITENKPSSQNDGRKYRYARRSNLELTEEIEEEAESSEDDGDEDNRVFDVELERNQNGSLGVQIASLNGRVCIKQLTSEPALSHPDIRVSDILLYVNGVAVEGKSHQEVVAMLRGGGDRVVLGVQRPPSNSKTSNGQTNGGQKHDQLISVMLQKKPLGTLGLSLAKRTMSDGIFIRNIASDSAASQEGTLRAGDRLVSLDGEPVEGLTPSAILERLKTVQGPVQITVTREISAN